METTKNVVSIDVRKYGIDGDADIEIGNLRSPISLSAPSSFYEKNTADIRKKSARKKMKKKSSIQNDVIYQIYDIYIKVSLNAR